MLDTTATPQLLLRGSLCAVVVAADGRTTVADDDGVRHYAWPADLHTAEQLDSVRLVWWSARDVCALVEVLSVQRCWDLAAVNRLIHGGARDDAGAVWAVAHAMTVPPPPHESPRTTAPDLFALGDSCAAPIRPGQQLPPGAGSATWLAEPDNREQWARAALHVSRLQAQILHERGPGLQSAYGESGAAWLCIELSAEGLPVDRPVLERLIESAAGPRPLDEADAFRIRRLRDGLVWRHTPGGREIDLRNPSAVREMLRQSGVVVEDTRAWHLEPYRSGSPLVDALLTWRKAERIATTYGWHWLDRFVGHDDRLRGEWEASDGGAGRMTAGSGLHSLPTPLRPGVAAADGHVLVRADLGQIEPRVLAVVARDPALAGATRQDDLYAGVAAELGIDRPTAKIAMLAAMYGQTSGTAGQALARLERAYPVAMGYLRQAALQGEQGEDVFTYGGRRVPVTANPDDHLATMRARGRFTRNAVVQGAAAELFKAWALTVRSAVRPMGGRVVLCLHDELLVHVPEAHGEAAAAAVDQALDDAARRWSGGAPVRFVSDTSVIRRWSEAKP